MTFFRAVYKVCFVFGLLTCAQVASAANRVEAKLPTYYQLMSMTPTQRVVYLTRVRQILTTAAVMGIGNPYKLVAEKDLPPDAYETVLNLILPKAYAGSPEGISTWFWQHQVIGTHAQGYQTYAYNYDGSGGGELYTCASGHTVNRMGGQICDNWDSQPATAAQIAAFRNQPTATASNSTMPPVQDLDSSAHGPDHSVGQYDMKDTAAQQADVQQYAKNHDGRDHSVGDYDMKDTAAQQDDIKKNQLAQNQSNTAKVCKAASKQEKDSFLKSGGQKCIYAGNINLYKDNTDRKEGTCSAPSSFCTAAPGTNPCPSKQKIACKNPNQVICNPFVFGLADSTKREPYCTDHSDAATGTCDGKAAKLPAKTSDNAAFSAYYRQHFEFLQSMDAVSSAWGQYSQDYNESCVGYTGNVHCKECTVMKTRLADLNNSKMFMNSFMKDGRLDGNSDEGSATAH